MSRLTRFVAQNFRNLEHVELDVPDGGLVVVGDNGHGKTNLLEAIAYLHALRSVRGARDVDLTRFGAPGFHLAAACAGFMNQEIRVGFERASRRKRVMLDGSPTARLTDGLGALPSVTVAPRDVELIAGAPSERRRYLDVLLALSSPRYLSALQDYRAALVRRNATIRAVASGRGGAEAEARLAAWEGPLVTAGATLCHLRHHWVLESGPRYAELCEALGERVSASLRYRASIDGLFSRGSSEDDVRSALQAAFGAHRASDLRRGATMIGPHRDDLELRLGGRLLRTFGSAGQQRSGSLALRVLEAESLERHIGRQPLLLLDDPFAELDRDRSRRVLDLLEARLSAQVILAVPRPDDVPGAFTGLARFRMSDGVVSPWPEEAHA
ncbi:MAG: DNA replication and repair protein RecF [Gemmatimonadaceae bacterium]